MLFIACSFVFFFGCKNIFNEPKTDNNSDTGTIVLSINGQESARTIMPDTILDDFTEFRLEFVALTTGNTSFEKIWKNNISSGTIEIAVGTWELTVKGYISGEQSGNLFEAARSVPTVLTIPAGDTIPVNILLLPIEEGKGTFSWDISFNGTFENASMELYAITYNEGGYAYRVKTVPGTFLANSTVAAT